VSSDLNLFFNKLTSHYRKLAVFIKYF